MRISSRRRSSTTISNRWGWYEYMGLPFGSVLDELWRSALGWPLSQERQLLQMGPHRLRTQITLALGGEAVYDAGMLM